MRFSGSRAIPNLFGFILTSFVSVSLWAQTDGLTVKGSQILRFGKPFVTKGLIFEGFLETVEQLEECRKLKKDTVSEFCLRHLTTRDFYFGTDKYTGSKQFIGNDALTIALRDWKINAVRFNVNQTALDHWSPKYSASYLSEIKTITAMARKKGLVVYLALFSASNRNAPEILLDANPYTPLDDQTTLRAARTLAYNFGKDKGVVIELMNEPWAPTPSLKDGWKLWRDGGILDNPKLLEDPWRAKFFGKTVVGVNKIIKEIRSLGAINLICLQGIGTFEEFPEGIIDPLNQVVYSLHPFMLDGSDFSINWYLRFGAFARKRPFVMTAFGASATEPWCKRDRSLAQKYLEFLSERKIGVIAYALDVPLSTTVNFRKAPGVPMGMSSTSCDWGGSGKLTYDQFRGESTSILPNSAPEILKFSGPSVVRIGDSVTFTIEAQDPDGDPLSYRVWWGDGTEPTPSADLVQSSNTFRHVFPYANKSGVVKVAIVVFDSRGARTQQEFLVRVVEPVELAN